MRTTRSLLTFLPLAALVGCTAVAPTADPVSDQPDMAGVRTPRDQPDLMPPSNQPPNAPQLIAPIQATGWMMVPVHGTADGAAVVLIDGTANGSISADVTPDGRFCAEVKLTANAVTSITLRAVSANGLMSEPVPLTIRQEGTPPSAPPAPEAQNAAIGGSGSSTQLGDEHGDASNLIDGDDDSKYGGWHESFSTYAEITVRLADRSRIKKVVYRAPDDCPFEAPFEVYYSNADAPSNPRRDPIAWTKISPQELVLDHATFNFTTPIIATHLSILWPYDGWGGYNCGNFWSGPRYSVSEVEAWTAPNTPPPPPTAPSCSGGG